MQTIIGFPAKFFGKSLPVRNITAHFVPLYETEPDWYELIETLQVPGDKSKTLELVLQIRTSAAALSVVAPKGQEPPEQFFFLGRIKDGDLPESTSDSHQIFNPVFTGPSEFLTIWRKTKKPEEFSAGQQMTFF